MGSEGNNHVAVEQGRIRWRRQRRGPIGGVGDRLAHGIIAIAAANLHRCYSPAGHLRDAYLAINSRMRTGRAYPGPFDARGDHRLILSQSSIAAGLVEMLLGLQLRAQIRLALFSLLLGLLLLRQLLRLAVGVGLGCGGTFGLCLFRSRPLRLGIGGLRLLGRRPTRPCSTATWLLPSRPMTDHAP